MDLKLISKLLLVVFIYLFLSKISMFSENLLVSVFEKVFNGLDNHV